jgi:hypothetical protein
MSTITIQRKLWHRLADVISDMGNHHPVFRGTAAGHNLGVLGNGIKYGVPPYEGASLDTHHQQLVEEASAVTETLGGIRPGLSLVEGFIEAADKLIGTWSER